MSNKFRFVGKIGLNALDARLPYKREGKTKDGNNYASFSCIVIPNKNNRGYCEVYGSVKDKIETFDNEGNKVSIPWSQRNDPEWLKKVAFYSQYSIKIGDEKHAFISDYDFVKFLCNNAEIIRDKTFIVTGNIAPNVYKGKVSQRFQIKNMIEADDAEEPKLEVTMDYVWTNASIDTGDWAENRTVNINGYINENIDKNNKNKHVLLPIVFDASKIDFSNEKHMAALNMKLKQIGLEFSNGSIKSKIKKEDVCKLPFKCRLINGAEEVAFDASQLTENQRSMIACGLMSLEDFKPKGNIYGERKTVYKLFGYDLRDDYADGYVTMKDLTPEDLADTVYKATEEPKAAEPVLSSENGIDLDDLFG